MILDRLFNRQTRPQDPRATRIWGGRQAGVVVTPDTALNFSAVFAATRVIAETVSVLPWETFNRVGTKRTRTPDSMVEYLLNERPNPEMSAFTLKEHVISHALLWGNGYAEIERDMAGRPVALWLLTPDLVTVRRDAETEKIYYEIASSNRGTSRPRLEPRDVYHLRGLGFDGLTGYSVVSLAAKSIGLSLSAERWGANYFGNSVASSGKITSTNSIGEKSREALKKQLKEMAGGENLFQPLVLPDGIDWNPMTLPASDAQFLETRKFGVTDIARWFRVPPHKLADLERATYTNIESQNTEFAVDTVLPWTTRMAQEANYKLYGANNNRSYTRINLRTLLKGDSDMRGKLYTSLRSMGVVSGNEIREWEDLEDAGEVADKLVMQTSFTTLERIGEEQETPQQPEPEKESGTESQDPAGQPPSTSQETDRFVFNLSNPVTINPSVETPQPPPVNVHLSTQQAAPPNVTVTVDNQQRPVRRVPVRDPETGVVVEVIEAPIHDSEST